MRVKTSSPKGRSASIALKKRFLPGLNIQAPWSQLIIQEKKTVETRFYPLPKKYIGKEMFIIETPGKTGKFKARLVGIVRFGEPFQYKSEKDFYADVRRHFVTKYSPLVNWSEGKGQKKWGWPIISVRKHSADLPKSLRRGIVFTANIPL